MYREGQDNELETENASSNTLDARIRPRDSNPDDLAQNQAGCQLPHAGVDALGIEPRSRPRAINLTSRRCLSHPYSVYRQSQIGPPGFEPGLLRPERRALPDYATAQCRPRDSNPQHLVSKTSASASWLERQEVAYRLVGFARRYPSTRTLPLPRFEPRGDRECLRTPTALPEPARRRRLERPRVAISAHP